MPLDHCFPAWTRLGEGCGVGQESLPAGRMVAAKFGNKEMQMILKFEQQLVNHDFMSINLANKRNEQIWNEKQ